VRICIDLDGVICQFKKPGETYAQVKPVPGALDKLKRWRSEGHYIIISTGRHMKSCSGNVGQVLAKQGLVTLQWLARHRVEYDEVHFGKPFADVYIDDNAVRFTSWEQFDNRADALPPSRESDHRKSSARKSDA